MDLRKEYFYILVILMTTVSVLYMFNSSGNYSAHSFTPLSSYIQGKSIVRNEVLPLCDQQTRKTRLREMCSQSSESSSRRENGYIMVVEKYKTLFCVPMKAGSSTMNSFMIKLSGDFNVSDDLPKDVSIHHPLHWRRHGIRTLSSIKKAHRKMILNTYFKVLVVRHPLDRLYSGYNDKFLYDKLYQPHYRPYAIERFRYGKKDKSLNYYKQFFPSEILRHAKHVSDDQSIELADDKQRVSKMVKKYLSYLPPFSSDDPHKPTFEEFLQFVLKTNAQDRHWKPMVDFCDPCNVYYDYIAKVETMSSDSHFILGNMARIRAIPPGLSIEHKRNLRNSDTSAIGKGVIKQLAQYKNVSFPIMQKIIRMYKRDMDYFGYNYNQTTGSCICAFHQSNNEDCC